MHMALWRIVSHIVALSYSSLHARCPPSIPSLQDYRPHHVFGSLESRIQKGVLARLKTAREVALKEFESAKCVLSQLKQRVAQ